MPPQVIPARELLRELPFPAHGIDVSIGFHEQRPGTTPVGVNGRFFEPTTKRARGASRQGLTRYVNDAMPGVIQELNFVVEVTGLVFGISFDDVPLLDLDFQLEDFADPEYLLADGTVNWIRIGGSGHYTPPTYTRKNNPEITDVSPGFGEFQGGETITVTGERMGNKYSDFTFGGQSANVITNDGNTATMIAPGRSPSSEIVEVDVQVETGEGESEITEDSKYEYRPSKCPWLGNSAIEFKVTMTYSERTGPSNAVSKTVIFNRSWDENTEFSELFACKLDSNPFPVYGSDNEAEVLLTLTQTDPDPNDPEEPATSKSTGFLDNAGTEWTDLLDARTQNDDTQCGDIAGDSSFFTWTARDFNDGDIALIMLTEVTVEFLSVTP